MNGTSSSEQPCWSNPDPPSMSWAELAQPAISEWALSFPDIAWADPQALRFVRDTKGDIEGIYRGRHLKLNVIIDNMIITLSSQQPSAKSLTKDEVRFKHIIHFLTSGRGMYWFSRKWNFGVRQ